MTIRIPRWIYHHALKAFTLLGPATIFTSDIGERHWSLAVAAVLLSALATISFVLAFYHARDEGCPYHRPRSAARLRRPHCRVALFLGAWSGPLFATAAIAAVLTLPFFHHSEEGDPVVDWIASSTWSAMCLLGAMYLATKRFHRFNATAPAPAAIAWAALRERAQGLIHHSHWLTLATAPLVLAGIAFAPEDGLWGSVRALSGVVLCVCIVMDGRHGMHLCEVCVTQFRVDAAEYAQARRWRFTTLHRFGGYVLVANLAALAISVFGEGWWDVALAAAFAICCGYSLLMRFHGTYQPWCPYCRRGGGGEDTAAAPTPTGGHGRPLPVA